MNEIVTLGSMFADCPHTRPLPLDISKGDCECELDKKYNGPIGIPNILDAIAADNGFSTTSMWVSVPQYFNNVECMQGTLELVHALSILLKQPLNEENSPIRPCNGAKKPMTWSKTCIPVITSDNLNANTISTSKPGKSHRTALPHASS